MHGVATVIKPGTQFGRWIVIGVTKRPKTAKQPRRYFACHCECGSEGVVAAVSLLSGDSKSCGCLKLEVAPWSTRRHGEAKSKLYAVLRNMINRCCNPKNPGYPDYGGRGIRVCPEWLADYVPFAEWARANGYKEGLEIDRVDNDGDYKPSNCRWVTKRRNQQNRRINYLFTAFGETKCLTEWSRDSRCSVGIKTLKWRIGRGLDPEAVIATPSQQGKALR